MGWYEDVFKGQGSSNKDYGNFNYDTEQDKIKRKRAFASQLQQQSMQSPKGEFFKSGDFTGYAGGSTKGSIIAQLAQAALAAYAGKSADTDQSSLNKDSLDALQFNMENKPWEKRLADAKVPDAPALQEAGSVQGSMPEAQTSPVREQPPNTARPLGTSPDGSSLGALVAGKSPAAVPVTGGPSTFVGNGTFAPLNTPPSSISPDQVKAAGLGGKVSADDISLLSSVLGGKTPPPAPATGPSAMPQLPTAAAPTAGPALPSPILPPTGLAPGAAATQSAALPQAPVAAQPQQAPQGPTMAEQMAYLQRVANSGPTGQQAAQMLQQQMMAKPQLQHVTVKNDDGSESIVAFDPSGRMKPQVVYQPQGGSAPTGKQLERDKFAAESFKNLSTAQEELNTAQQQYNKVQNARDMLTKYAPTGGVFSNIYSGIAKALGNDKANALDMALRDLAFSDLRGTFGGNPTEGERKAQMDVKASVERGLAPSQASLDILAAGVERRMRTGQQQVEYWKGMNEQYRSRPQGGPGSASGMADSLFPRR